MSTFWMFLTSAAVGLLFYAFIGYGLLMQVLLRFKQMGKGKANSRSFFRKEWPEVTLLVPAYNEADILADKWANCRSLDYPAGKLELLFVTDGSDDGSEAVLRGLDADLRVLHQPQRRGKSAAINRAMPAVRTPIVVMTDANTMLQPDALRHLVRAYDDPQVGAVSGEKKVLAAEGAGAAQSEGLYWRYESWLKRVDAGMSTLVGAAGELFSMRTVLFQPIPEQTILDDFELSVGIAARGYKVDYVPEAVATELPSANVAEEFKRKVRIAAGGVQSIWRFRRLFDLRRYGWLGFQFLSHRALRWTLTPWALITAFLANTAWVLTIASPVAWTFWAAQTAFYLLALNGWRTQTKGRRFPGARVAFYFVMMHYAVLLGQLRWLKNQKPQAAWERSRRAQAA